MQKVLIFTLFLILSIAVNVIVTINECNAKSDDNLKVAFKNDIQPVLKKYCSKCHRKFTKFHVFKKKSGKIKYMLKTNKMPPKTVKGFTKENRETLINWIDAKM